MPELPEVETIRRGLVPVMAGAVFTWVDARRSDLRFPLPDRFADRLAGACVNALDRRGKYLIAGLSSGESLIMHLGMSGRFIVESKGRRRSNGDVAPPQTRNPSHDHVVFHLENAAAARVAYNDPRRFGFMDLVFTDRLDSCRHFKGFGPEPLDGAFTAQDLNAALCGRSALIKAALLDQRVVAGLGNIYVCEALYRARISPRRRADSVAGTRGIRLHSAIIEVLQDAIAAGGSSLRDFAAADGALGYFQHRFDVYGREGADCRRCDAPIQRLVQSGRSTFFCPRCQR